MTFMVVLVLCTGCLDIDWQRFSSPQEADARYRRLRSKRNDHTGAKVLYQNGSTVGVHHVIF